MIGPGTGVRVYDHVPLYRQGEIFARLGIDIPRSTLIGWTGSAIAELRPIAELIGRSTQTATHLHCDDTIIRCSPRRPAQTRRLNWGRIEGWWCGTAGPIRGRSAAVALLLQSRSQGRASKGFMKGFSGVLQADGFSQASTPVQARSRNREIQVKEAGCWAHWRGSSTTSISPPLTDRQGSARSDRQAL